MDTISKALDGLFSAKTMTLWIVLALIAFLAFLIASIVTVVFKISLEGYFQDLLAFLGLGGTGGTARNVISDGIAPRAAMVVAARTDPSIAVESPSPMTAKDPALATTRTYAFTPTQAKPAGVYNQPPVTPIS